MKCVSCRGGEPTLTDSEIEGMLPQVPEWQVIEVDGINRLERVFKLKNFIEAVAFTNKIALIAEKEDHHPLITTEYGRVTVDWWTHKIKGLHQNDFIMAAKTDKLF
jgi:4a-hydroxytetrahydrobiopterin dehydratase